MKLTRVCPTPDECGVVLDLRAENERLRRAFQEYAEHDRNCEVVERAGSCTCGFDAIYDSTVSR